MFEMVIEKAKELAKVDGFKGKDFTINKKKFFVDIDSDGTLFITVKGKDDWDIFAENIIL